MQQWDRGAEGGRWSGLPPVARVGAATIVLLLTAGCSGLGGPERWDPAEFAWPAGNPRVSLERVIKTRTDLGRSGILRRLAGHQPPPLFQRPYAVAWSGDDLLVTDPGAGRVHRIAPGGRLSSSSEGLFENSVGIAACSAGVLVSDSRAGRVALLDRQLRLAGWVAEGLDRPTGIACDGDRIFVVETGRHRVLALEASSAPAVPASPGPAGAEAGGIFFAPAGEGPGMLGLGRDRITRVLGRRGERPGEFNFPTTISPGLGSLWVGDAMNFRLQRFDPVTGRFLGTFGRLGDAAGEMPRLKAVAIDAAGHLWLSDAHLDQVALYRPDGVFLMALGGTGNGPGEFSFPAGIAAHPDGRVAVVDSFNRRLQIFRLMAPAAEGG